MKKWLFFGFISTFFAFSSVLAIDYSSTNFVDQDPVISVVGGRSTSTNFQMLTVSGEVVIGQSTSTNFMNRAGFLYFPNVASPIVSATPGDAAVTLSWTSAVGVLGYTISSYEVGRATVSGGPYSYSNVGNVLSSVRSGLANGTPYYFVVRALDYYGNHVVTSTQVSATPVAAAPPGGGGGGGGGAGPTTVIFSGRAYPGSTVTLLRDAQVAATTISGGDASFSITLSNITGGNYIFAIYSEDNKGRRSTLLTFPVSVTTGATTNVSGIFLSPTIATDKSEVKKGDDIVIFGQSAPLSDIIITVNSETDYFVQTKSARDGGYLYTFDTSFLELGQHTTKSKASLFGQISQNSPVVSFEVGNRNVNQQTGSCGKDLEKADLNDDCKVNLVDFSIAAYWWKRTLSPAFADLMRRKTNKDGLLDLRDFSIMAYYWTG